MQLNYVRWQTMGRLLNAGASRYASLSQQHAETAVCFPVTETDVKVDQLAEVCVAQYGMRLASC